MGVFKVRSACRHTNFPFETSCFREVWHFEWKPGMRYKNYIKILNILSQKLRFYHILNAPKHL